MTALNSAQKISAMREIMRDAQATPWAITQDQLSDLVDEIDTVIESAFSDALSVLSAELVAATDRQQRLLTASHILKEKINA